MGGKRIKGSRSAADVGNGGITSGSSVVITVTRGTETLVLKSGVRVALTVAQGRAVGICSAVLQSGVGEQRKEEKNTEGEAHGVDLQLNGHFRWLRQLVAYLGVQILNCLCERSAFIAESVLSRRVQ